MLLLLLWHLNSVAVCVRTDSLGNQKQPRNNRENFYLGQEGNDENVLNKLMKQSKLQRGREKTREAGSAEIGQSIMFEGTWEER